MPNESFDLAGPVGRLEALLMHPAGEVEAAAVLCHAHPLHGGMMHFKVLFRIAKALQELGVATLRFNFRGVGRSAGVHDGGVGEQEDARAALDEMERRFPGRPIVLGGFSFGSVMALRVAAREPQRVGAVPALGLPIAHMTDLSYLPRITQPRLFVQGANDEFGPMARIQEVVAALPEPKTLIVIDDADHYFTGRLDEMQAAVTQWAATAPWRQPR
jgi:alpha/beta superfamily hydrolase